MLPENSIINTKTIYHNGKELFRLLENIKQQIGSGSSAGGEQKTEVLTLTEDGGGNLRAEFLQISALSETTEWFEVESAVPLNGITGYSPPYYQADLNADTEYIIYEESGKLKIVVTAELQDDGDKILVDYLKK